MATKTTKKKRVTTAQLVAAAAGASGVSKAETRRVLRHLVEEIASAIQTGHGVTVAGLGTFSLRRRKATKARTMKSGLTGKMMKIPAKPAGVRPGFRFARAIKDSV